MQLRSGNIIPNMQVHHVRPKKVINPEKLKRIKEAHDLIYKQYVCFGTSWPSLEEARNLSIKTDDIQLFGEFAKSLIARAQDKNNLDKDTNRLCFLTIIESFFRCGLPVLKKYHGVMLIAYVKLEGAFSGTLIPKDMNQYLMKFKELIIQVENAKRDDLLAPNQ
jgi:hypothetical protein